MHYYPHHIGDFTKDTYFLNNEEVGIVIRLLGLYYDTEKPFKNDISLLSIKVSAEGKEDVVQKVLGLIFKYDETDNLWKQTRCDKEIEHYHAIGAIRKKGGEESAKKRKKDKELWFNLSSTQALLTKNQEPITNNQKKKEQRGLRLASDFSFPLEWEQFCAGAPWASGATARLVSWSQATPRPLACKS